MDKIAFISNEERRKVFIEVAHKNKITPEVVEKDFWVSWILGKIFDHPILSEQLCFKGGTSLSKVFGVIKRFSEDIDLILAEHVVLNDGESLSVKQESNRKQTTFNKEINKRAGDYIQSELRMHIEKCVHPICELINDEKDTHILWVRFPRIFDDFYIQSDVKLEIGPLALWNPNERYPITSFVTTTLPELKAKIPIIPTIKVERTFWEKITILHSEHYRPESSLIPERYSRHYYDVFKMANTGIKQNALAQLDLLQEVVNFKMRFYGRAWAKYEEASLGSLRLSPAPHCCDVLARDYAQMRSMIYDDYPSWDEILQFLNKLEQELNS